MPETGRAGFGQAAAAAAFGATLAFHQAALSRLIAALFWPKLALALLLLASLAAGAGALAAVVLPEGWRERARRLGWAGYVLCGGSMLGGFFATGHVAESLLPGTGVGIGSFPLWFLMLLAVPFGVAGAAAASWAGAGEAKRIGWLGAGAGAGLLAFALVPAVTGQRIGSPQMEFVAMPGDSFGVGIDRRLREDVVAPRPGAEFPFTLYTGRDGILDVLMIGFPNGSVLADLLARGSSRITILESDARLVEEVVSRWPALSEARREGRVRFLGGNPRWELQRRRGRFDLIALAEGRSYAAALSGALNFEPDYRYTVEAFRSYLRHLRPRGYLFVQRNGIGRVVSTLREASGLSGAAFADRIVILGAKGRLVSQCWYRRAGLKSPASVTAIRQYMSKTGSLLLYRPRSPFAWSFYYALVKDPRVKGLYFSTPIDLSPQSDSRPFFDHLERLRISPTGSPLPEELGPLEGSWVLRVIPAGDWPVFVVLFFGLALAAGAGVALRHRSGTPPGAAGVLPTAIFLGAGTAAVLEAFAAWASWLSPSAVLADAALAAAVGAAGVAWVRTSRAPGRRGMGLLLTAGILVLFAAAGYRVAPALPRLGDPALASLVILAGVALGTLAGNAVRSSFVECLEGAPGSGGAWIATALVAGTIARAAAPLLAVSYGYTVLWALAAVAVLAARRRRRFLRAVSRHCEQSEAI